MTIVAVLLIAMATLPPAPGNPIEPRWQCLVCGSTGMTDVVGERPTERAGVSALPLLAVSQLTKHFPIKR